ncbi:hypothetical protein D3C74_171220 [compost metagenome]
MIERLYVDNVSGKVTDERYEKMSAKFEAEQAELLATVDTLETKIAEQESQAVNVDWFLSVVRRYATDDPATARNSPFLISKLTPLRAGTILFPSV